MPRHTYRVAVDWSGDGTRGYRSYRRDHTVAAVGKLPIEATSGIAPMSAAASYNPEELLVGALASCHMLWYLHLASDAGVVVTAYHDDADGVLELGPDGSGQLTRVTLRPRVVVAAGDPGLARSLHEAAHDKCFVARSVNFPVAVEPEVVAGAEDGGPGFPGR